MAIPKPEPGLILNFSYLWHGEFLSGQEEGRKNRPCVIVLSVFSEGEGITRTIVLPITHSPPEKPEYAVEIPASVKSHLGLDEQRSWIMVTEGNDFIWPGFDLRKRPGSQRYDFGFLPPNLFRKVRDAFVAFHQSGQAKSTPRT
jgi:PemK-like, MazF-like toxin of type II toxin-antitoxin system